MRHQVLSFLFAALAQAMLFLRDEARQGIWDTMAKQKREELMASSWDARIPKQEPLRTRYL